MTYNLLVLFDGWARLRVEGGSRRDVQNRARQVNAKIVFFDRDHQVLGETVELGLAVQPDGIETETDIRGDTFHAAREKVRCESPLHR